MPTYRFLHRPSVQAWFDEFYATLGIMHDIQNAPAKIAVLFMVFSIGSVYMPDNDRPGPLDLSAQYFLAAEHQLRKEKGSIRLTSVQARLAQCCYLLTQSRINHCWSLFGTVSHLALAIGLNRNRYQQDLSRGLGRIEVECRRRTFWCAYTLDAYLSAALGRPRSFHDDDIDAELPACVDDAYLTNDLMITPVAVSKGPSTMLAPLGHMKIARIISHILRDLYSVKPVSAEQRLAAMKSISSDLGDWRAEFSRFLDVDLFSASLLVSIFQRQRNVLNLTYWHAIILTHRSFVLSNFAGLLRQNDSSVKNNQHVKDSVEKCIDAATKTVNTIEDMAQQNQLFRSLWITSYFAFNASIILYIYAIQHRDCPPEEYADQFEAAERCQRHISAIAEKGSLSERYWLVLEELRVEVLHQTGRNNQISSGSDNGDASVGVDEHGSAAMYSDLAASGTVGGPDATVHDFPISDYSGWGNFTSMVSSGLSNLDVLLGDDFSLPG
ncbi:Zn(2)Cys(6) transcription factor [Pochonia chlamydosporia 170]|uniref:Zn(2)Cys(6) transcription factor n=1 Tax=Pochonia chlamydosporia 170 TaxID=1380566 RepID=A0A179G2B9_METCM|nr:Zn(2)Cys(6) transcription factor [Pochonia chlamydosporia 170]OAQ72002.2 Zn(2)Cys(6) transcription factor [Pochonia chlamydosporia 170]